MATTLITVEEYLRTSYEPDAEYVDGVIEERPMGEGKHSAWQMTIGAFFFMRSREWHIRVRPELRTQTGARRYRIPDLAIISPEAAEQPIATVAPLVAIEILSPERTASLGFWFASRILNLWVFQLFMLLIPRMVLCFVTRKESSVRLQAFLFETVKCPGLKLPRHYAEWNFLRHTYSLSLSSLVP